MAHETRTSEQGTVFDASTVRDYLLKALYHDAVIDRMNELLSDYAMTGQIHPSVITASLKPIIDEVLSVAEYEDWDWVASTLIAEACEALGVEDPHNRTPESRASTAPTREGALRSPDSGQLREKPAEIYTHKHRPLGTMLRARQIIRRIAQLTKISRERISVDAQADAQAIHAADHETAMTDQSSALKPARTADPPR